MPHFNKQPTQELLVRGDVIRELFDPPLPTSTFHDKVNAGKVVKARLHGWYKLNATRVNLGMQPIDIESYRAKGRALTEQERQRALLFLALVTLGGEELLSLFSGESLPECLSPLDVEKVQHLMEAHSEGLKDSDSLDEVVPYVVGALDATAY